MSAPAVLDVDTERKAFARLQARAALAGYSLHRTAAVDGSVSYLVSRWNICRELRDADAVDAWLARAGA